MTFFEIVGTQEIERFIHEKYFPNYDFLNNWVVEYLQTSNVWKNKNMLIKIKTIPTPQKSTIFLKFVVEKKQRNKNSPGLVLLFCYIKIINRFRFIV